MREKFLAASKREFSRADENGDGYIELEELKKNEPYFWSADGEDVFAALDKDGDRKVHLDEFMVYFKVKFVEALNAMMEKVLAESKRKFNTADENGDGYIEIEELKRIPI